MRVLLASTNEGKIAELKQILGEEGIEILGLSESSSTQGIEVGSTFAENALLKARHYCERRGLPTIADDSGLEVEALNGAPGIYSARYVGVAATDSDRILKLLDEMKGLEPLHRRARFVCAAAFVWEGGEKVFLDEAPGIILESARGISGFGYDPIFFYEPLGKTFAELTPSQKADVSHRGRAFRQLAAWLTQSGVLDSPGPNDKIVGYRE